MLVAAAALLAMVPGVISLGRPGPHDAPNDWEGMMPIAVALAVGLVALAAGLVVGVVQCLRGHRSGWWLAAIFGSVLVAFTCLAMVPVAWMSGSWPQAAILVAPAAFLCVVVAAVALLQFPAARRYLDA